ncbi:MAG TPA: protein-L-isoaspartate(D-aspartate) O-methyltransferase [Armatimonadota bacterium]|nr:protein-L-isoaspartate(D-aspartate) O-methyltransferase [Armatimonadota bacterium]
MDDFAEARRQMVETQLRRRGITDERVLAAMAEVPRHRFVPVPDAGAYGDHPLAIGAAQTISQPYMVALMTQLLALQGAERVLEVGTGSGYQAAVLAELCRRVYSIERIPELAARAQRLLAELGYDNVEVVVGDGTLGLPGHAPYDGIIVTAATPALPLPWIEQLAEGGRMVVPVGNRAAQSLVVATKEGGEIKQRYDCGCVFVPLIGKHGFPEAH